MRHCRTFQASSYQIADPMVSSYDFPFRKKGSVYDYPVAAHEPGRTAGPELLSLVAVAASHGATVIAVSKVHLGVPATVSEAFAPIKRRILGLAGIMMGLGLGIGIGFLCLIIPGILLALMWSLTIPVAVVEGTGLVGSVQRSADLTKGSWGRIFV